MGYEVWVEQLDAQPVAFVRERCRPDELGGLFDRILPEVYAHVMTQPDGPAGPPFARYLSFTDEAVDVEIGVPTAGEIASAERIRTGELPGGSCAVLTHEGHYDGLGQAHAAMHEWLTSHGHEIRAGWESYVMDPGGEPDPAKWRTLVVYPLS